MNAAIPPRVPEAASEVGSHAPDLCAVLLGPTIRHVSSKIALYLVLSLILVRVLPVAAPDAREQRRVAHGAFVRWLGPRGLGSIVFA